MSVQHAIPVLLPAAVVALAACGEERTNPPTDPAPPVVAPEAAAPPPEPPAEIGRSLPGAGPPSFVGRWAADIAWCSNAAGPQRPIEITTTRFEGYENSCALESIDERGPGYDVVLRCQAEGQTARERVRMEARDGSMRLTWVDREGAVILLTRCGAGLPPSSE